MFVERLWRNIKYEAMYFSAHDSGSPGRRPIRQSLERHHRKRSRSSRVDPSPGEGYFAAPPAIPSAA
ncbi:hypothetical protein [Pandoraea oxalativorans]|uniref:hypothetical protein n=1 Tax=Pandoraea oxalativorans TaxID=573737 RepID=UPI0012F5155D